MSSEEDIKLMAWATHPIITPAITVRQTDNRQFPGPVQGIQLDVRCGGYPAPPSRLARHLQSLSIITFRQIGKFPGEPPDLIVFSRPPLFRQEKVLR
jgi:hypothetical protein